MDEGVVWVGTYRKLSEMRYLKEIVAVANCVEAHPILSSITLRRSAKVLQLRPEIYSCFAINATE